MQLIDGKPVFSATDLVGYLACEHLTALERMALEGLAQRPHRRDRELDIIRERGFQHERRFLDELVAEGRSVVTVERRDEEDRRDAIARRAVETVDAMASGADVVYQATFFDGTWLGYADFLLKVEDVARPSVWGPWHYEVADTKLARHVKAGAVLQICSYVEQLTRIQGVAPTRMLVALGGSARETAELRVEDYMAYYRSAKRRFEEAFAMPPGMTYPEPVDHCDVCRWNERCTAQRRADDHLSLVAGISGRQRKALVARGIDTVVKLAAAPIPFDPPLDGTGAASIERVREQARLQVEGRAVAPELLYELLEPEPERGLGILPPPDPGDLFLDLEGDPYAWDDGIDYLFGLLDTDGAFTAEWSTDPDGSGDITLAGEKAAFERLMDRVAAQRARHPDMHVYHYAAYEPTALKRLMGRHATREKEVDELLRGGVLVDLYRAVRQGLRASVESYSIKRIEPLYGFKRAIELRDATSSIVAFEEWLQLPDRDRPTSELLREIELYNRDDVRSTLVLRDWLERLRDEAATQFGVDVARPGPRSPDAPPELTEADERVRDLAERLTSGVPAEGRTDEEQARWLLAQLLSLAPARGEGCVLGVLRPDGQGRGRCRRGSICARPARAARQGRRTVAADTEVQVAADVGVSVRAAGVRPRRAGARPLRPRAVPRAAGCEVEGVEGRRHVPPRRRRECDRRAHLAAGRRSTASGVAEPAEHLQRQGAACRAVRARELGGGARHRQRQPRMASGARPAPPATATGWTG